MLIKKLGIVQVPAVVAQEGKVLNITENYPKFKKSVNPPFLGRFIAASKLHYLLMITKSIS